MKKLILASMISGLLFSGSVFAKQDLSNGASDGVVMDFTTTTELFCGIILADQSEFGTTVMDWKGESDATTGLRGAELINNEVGGLYVDIQASIVLDPLLTDPLTTDVSNYRFYGENGGNDNNVILNGVPRGFDKGTGYNFHLEANSDVFTRANYPFGDITNTVTLTISCTN